MTKRKASHGEGSVYKSSDPKRTRPWVVQITADGKRRTTYYATSREAYAAKRKMLHELEQGQLVTSKPQTVKTYMEQWLSAKLLELKAGTYENYEELTHLYIIPAIGHYRLQKLTDAHIQDMYAKLPRHLSPNTVRHIHCILSSALNTALRQHKIAANPLKLVTPPREVKQELAYLTLEQAQHLLAVAAGHPLECLLTLAIATGMRQGELLALRWTDIDFTKKTVHVTRSLSYHNPDGQGFKFREEEPKTASSRRTIPLPDFAIEALGRHRVRQLEQRLKAATWEDKGLIFTRKNGAYLWAWFMVNLELRKLLSAAGLPEIRFHDLRHTAATILLGLGVNPKVVQEWLGHSHISITLAIYAHVTEGMRQEATTKLNEQFRKTGEG